MKYMNMIFKCVFQCPKLLCQAFPRKLLIVVGISFRSRKNNDRFLVTFPAFVHEVLFNVDDGAKNCLIDGLLIKCGSSSGSSGSSNSTWTIINKLCISGTLEGQQTSFKFHTGNFKKLIYQIRLYSTFTAFSSRIFSAVLQLNRTIVGYPNTESMLSRKNFLVIGSAG